MVDISAIAGLVGATKALGDIGRAMIGLRDEAEFQSKRIEFQDKLLEVQNGAFVLQEERSGLLQNISDLEKRVATLEAEKSQKHRYQLKDYGGDTFAYELKESEAHDEPTHRACPKCFNSGQISILQFSHKSEGGQDWYDCLGCKARLHFGVYISTDLRSSDNEYFE